MKTPSPFGGEGVERCLGDNALSKSLAETQQLRRGNNPSIRVDGLTVRIIGGSSEIGVPRRQGFAWATDARAYAERLSAEHGWPIEVKHGGR